MINQMGALPFSEDFLGISHIGKWVIERDEGCEPRLYADEVMLHLLGISDNKTPEENYKIWKDGVNSKQREVVEKAFMTMAEGKYKEIQYLWKGENADTRNVRSAGIRNYDYSKGVRIEGIHRDVTTGIKQKSEMAYNNNVISTLASDYLCVFTDDIDSNEARLVFATPEVSQIILDIFNGKENQISYEERTTSFCEKIVHPDDMNIFMDTVTSVNLSKKIKNHQHTSVQFRAARGNKYIHLQANIYPYSIDSPSKIVVGIKDDEEEFLEREKIKENEEMRLSLLEDVRTGAVLNTMTDDFDIVAYIDYDSGDITPYKITPSFMEVVRELGGAITKTGELYSEIGKVVYKEDLDYVLRLVDKDNVLGELAKSKTFSFDCRVMRGGVPTYYRVKYAHDPSNEKAVIIGLENVDIQIRKEIEYRKEAEFRENAQRIIELTENFESIYDINVETREFIETDNEGIHRGIFPTSDEEGIKRMFNADATGKMSEIYEEDRAKIANLMSESVARRLDEEGTITVDYRRKKDDSLEWYRMRMTKFGDWKKEKRIIIGIFNNDQNMKNEEVRRTFQEICSALSTSFESLYYINIEDDTYYEYNSKERDGFYELDIAGEEFFKNIYTKLQILAYPDDLHRTRAFFDKDRLLSELVQKETVSIEYRLLELDNSVYYHRARVLKGSTDNKHILVAVENIGTEIAEREKKQRQLEEALQMAQSANRAKTSFLNNMSHDIRTPMNAIIGFTGLASAHIDNTSQVQEYLRKIGQSSQHLLSLINDVLDMSRIESGKINLVEKEEKLSDLVDTVRNIISSDIQAKKMKLEVEMSEVKDDVIICDKLRLNQVLINTVSNAIKYTPEGGNIFLGVGRGTKSNSYRFTVRDNGIGMSEDFLKTIYDPFTRVNSSTVSGIQGTGLGMSITKNIVDMMKGTIDIKSKENSGTEVTMEFCFETVDTALVSNDEEKQVTVETVGNDESVWTVKKFLLVEDNELNREIAEEVLTDAGFEVMAVNDGTEAVEVMKNAKPGDFQLILMDIQMPIMDGCEATRRIRAMESEYAKKIPIIAMSANAFDEDKKVAMEAGMNDYIAKPIELDSLFGTIERFSKHF